MLRTMISLAAIACSLLAAGCNLGPKTVKIGVAGPMTGPNAKQGNDFLNGVQLAADEWNAKGGVLGRKIEVIPVDDRSDPKEAVMAANKLVNLGAAGVIGHYESSCTIPASMIYAEAGVVQITPSSTNPALTLDQRRSTVFRACGRDDQQGSMAATFVRDRLKLRKVAVIDDKTTYGQGLAREFERNLGQGIAVVAYENIQRGDKDFSAILTKIKPLAPEAVYFGGYYTEAGLLATQMRRQGVRAAFISGDATIDQEFLNIAGRDAEGAYLSYGPDVRKLESAKGFVAAYTAKFGPLGPYSLYAYDAANVLLRGIEAAQTAEGAKVAAAIHGLSFNGARGELSFDENGDLRNIPYVMWVVRNGAFEVAN